MSNQFHRDPYDQMVYDRVVMDLAQNEISVSEVVAEYYSKITEADALKKIKNKVRRWKNRKVLELRKETEAENNFLPEVVTLVPDDTESEQVTQDVTQPKPKATQGLNPNDTEVTQAVTAKVTQTTQATLAHLKDFQCQQIENLITEARALLKNDTAGMLSGDLDRIQGVERAIDNTLQADSFDPKEIDSLVRALSRLIEVKRAALLMPFGHTAPPNFRASNISVSTYICTIMVVLILCQVQKIRLNGSLF